jgi:AcrR family transcriptional regulator
MSDEKLNRQDKYARRFRQARDAAANVFAEKDYHGASTGDIADRLNIRQGSLYYYFRSKEIALEEVCFFSIARTADWLESILHSELAFRDKIYQVFVHTFNWLEEFGDYIIVFNEQRHYIPPEHRQRIREQSHRYHKNLELMLEEAQRRGEVRDDLDCHIAVRALTGMLNSVTSRYYRELGFNLDSTRFADQFTDLFLLGVSCQQDDS